MPVPWRVARSLETLREQINDRYPTRDKASDGTIGDTDHQNRSSDHNPWYQGHIVTALDITHDPGAGVDIDRLTDELAASRDRRIKYVIANDLIMSGAGGPSPWVWREYHGTNLHTSHFHLSVVASPACDDTSPWDLPSLRGGGSEQEDYDMDKVNALHSGMFYGSSVKGKKYPGLLAIVAETQRRVTANTNLLARKSGLTADAVAEALAPRLSVLLLPELDEVVETVLGADNQDQARAIVDELSRRLAIQEMEGDAA